MREAWRGGYHSDCCIPIDMLAWTWKPPGCSCSPLHCGSQGQAIALISLEETAVWFVTMLAHFLMGGCRERERERDIMRSSGMTSMDNGYSEEQHDGIGSPSTDYSSSSSSRSGKSRNLESR